MGFVFRFVGVCLTIIMVGLIGYLGAQLQERRQQEISKQFAMEFIVCMQSADADEFLDWAEDKKLEYSSVEEIMESVNRRWEKRMVKTAEKCLPNAERLAFEVSGNPNGGLLDSVLGTPAAQANFIQNLATGLLFVLVGIGLEAIILRRF